MAAIKFDRRHPGISVYEALINKELSEEEKAKIIAEAIDTLSKEFPNLKDVATSKDLTETELRLTKEIEATRKEIKEIELRLTQDIEATRKEIKEIEANLQKEIKELDLKLSKEIKEVELKLSKEIKELDLKLSKEIKETKFTMLKWQFVFWISQMAALVAILYKILS